MKQKTAPKNDNTKPITHTENDNRFKGRPNTSNPSILVFTIKDKCTIDILLPNLNCLFWIFNNYEIESLFPSFSWKMLNDCCVFLSIVPKDMSTWKWQNLKKVLYLEFECYLHQYPVLDTGKFAGENNFTITIPTINCGKNCPSFDLNKIILN